MLAFKTFLAFGLIGLSTQHGRMFEPPARNSMWRMGFPTKPNYEDSQMFCGGIMVQWKENNGKCGICGDSYSMKPPRPYETGGIYAPNMTVRVYAPGSQIDVVIDLVANHMGFFEFSLCPRNDPNERETEECFIPLKVNGSDRYRLTTHRKGIFNMPVELPRDVTCTHCVFRWHWKSANNWGVCANGTEAIGCGPQETYRNCADIIISHDLGIRGLNSIMPIAQSWERLIMATHDHETAKDDLFPTYHPVDWPENYKKTEIDEK